MLEVVVLRMMGRSERVYVRACVRNALPNYKRPLLDIKA